MRFRSVHELTSADLGQRVTVRRTLPEGGYGDVVGMLEEINGEELVVRDRNDRRITIARADVVAARIVKSR